MRLSGLLLVALACSALPSEALGETRRPQPMEDRFFTVVLTADERVSYELLSEAAKRVYQRMHWGRLDPTPGSEENEREREHQRRVVEAIGRFVDPWGRFRWVDRARGWIRFGSPARVDSVQGALVGDRLFPSCELWSYDDALFFFEDRDLSGSYVFGRSPGGVPITPGREERLRAMEGFPRGPAAEATRAAIEQILSSFGIVPAEANDRIQNGERLWKGLSERNERKMTESAFQFTERVAFLGRGDGLTCLLVSIGVPLGELGRALDVDGGDRSVRVEIRSALRDSTYAFAARSNKSLSVVTPSDSPAAGNLVAVDSLIAGPGEYRIVVEVEDLAAGRSGFLVREIEVPAFVGGPLRLSSLVLAERITTDFRAKGLARRGGYRIDPNPDGAYVRGTTVHAYFESYGLRPDRDGRFHSEIAYSLETDGERDFSARFRGTEKGRLRRGDWARSSAVGRGPTSSHWIAIDTAELPAGAYTLVAEATDRSTGEVARTAERFVIRE